MTGTPNAHSLSFGDNIFDQMTMVDREPIVKTLKEKLYCPECGDSGEADTFQEAVDWNLAHINRHNPQPELTILINSARKPAVRKKRKPRVCHLCAESRTVYETQDNLKWHVRRTHNMGMIEFREAPAA